MKLEIKKCMYKINKEKPLKNLFLNNPQKLLIFSSEKLLFNPLGFVIQIQSDLKTPRVKLLLSQSFKMISHQKKIGTW